MRSLKIILLTAICFYGVTVFGQEKKPNREMEQLLDFSRPAAMHQLLGKLAGSWNFQDAKLAFVKGTLTRTPRYDGRFFDVEITGGKLQLPVAVGMKEDNYRSFQLEGYDNVQKQFVTISVNNHIGSDIEEQRGQFNAAKNELVYEWESELLQGKKVQNRRVITLVSASYYKEEYYESHHGRFEKTRELDYRKE